MNRVYILIEPETKHKLNMFKAKMRSKSHSKAIEILLSSFDSERHTSPNEGDNVDPDNLNNT